MDRPEYPRPQFVRELWLNLNGEWSFEFDDENRGLKEGWFKHAGFKKKINVPFAYQTKLSGIADPGFHDYCWYNRTFTLPEKMKNKKIILHFGAVDYRAAVYLNGAHIGTHEGGHTSFSFDISPYLKGGDESLTLRVYDPSTDETIPRGKQFWQETSEGIWYTRTTGIWQTVWLEAVEETHVKWLRFTPNIDAGDINIEWEMAGDYSGKLICFDISFKGKQVIKTQVNQAEPYGKSIINLFNMKIFRSGNHSDGWLWSPENPNLFDIGIKVLDKNQAVLDKIDSYFGMRKIHTENGMVYLNNRPYYQKLVLDQGYWPEGLLTAPTDDALKADIKLAKEAGFNGARKHQKVEDPRYLYWADKIGFLVWGECASSPSFNEIAVARLTKEWIEIIKRDYNHPCIVTWVPINESWGVSNINYVKQQADHTLGMYYLIKSLDQSRLVISNDGWEMTVTDICAIHNYNHGQRDEAEKYAYYLDAIATKDNILSSGHANRNIYADGFSHQGEPVLLTEFGGIAYKTEGDAGWGYTVVSTEEEYLEDYERIMKALFASKVLHGYCYTQLTDVEQEINGILTYDRKPKCDLSALRRLNNMWHVPFVNPT